jgi:hypothetical protein
MQCQFEHYPVEQEEVKCRFKNNMISNHNQAISQSSILY